MLSTLRPQHLVEIIAEDYPHIGSEAIFVYHGSISHRGNGKQWPPAQ
jgi:hypothetical protein